MGPVGTNDGPLFTNVNAAKVTALQLNAANYTGFAEGNAINAIPNIQQNQCYNCKSKNKNARVKWPHIELNTLRKVSGHPLNAQQDWDNFRIEPDATKATFRQQNSAKDIAGNSDEFTAHYKSEGCGLCLAIVGAEVTGGEDQLGRIDVGRDNARYLHLNTHGFDHSYPKQ